jgi:hypothetical protein
MNARRLWLTIYCIAAILTLWSGYRGLEPAQTARTNADWIFVSITFVLTCLFPLSAMAYSRSIGVQEFRRPSLDRHPFGWWRDTLQPLRASLVAAALSFVGACFALPRADARGVMILWFYAASALGLLIGERLVYVIFRKRIA